MAEMHGRYSEIIELLNILKDCPKDDHNSPFKFFSIFFKVDVVDVDADADVDSLNFRTPTVWVVSSRNATQRILVI
jgi:hypothetical protein